MDERRIRDGELVGRVEFDELGPQESIAGTAGLIPQRWTLTITVERSVVTLAFHVHGGATKADKLTVEPPSSSVLRVVITRLERWTELCERELVTTEQVMVLDVPPTPGVAPGSRLIMRGGPVLGPDEEAKVLDAAARALHERRLVTDEELMKAAAAYYDAPVKKKHAAVMDALDCDRSRANHLIRRCKDRGLIERVGQGRAAK